MIIHATCNTKNKTNRSKLGVTLVELLIVVSIIAVVSLAIIPSYVDFSQTKDFNNKTETIVTEITNVRNKALSGAVISGSCVTDEVNWGFKPTCSGTQYTLGYQCPGGSTFYTVATQTMPTNVTFDATTCSTIVFQRLSGAPVSAGSITLKYKTSTRTINVNSAGRIGYN